MYYNNYNLRKAMYGMDMSSPSQAYGQQQSAGSVEEQLLQTLMQMKQQGFTDVQMVEQLIGMGIPQEQAPAIVSAFTLKIKNAQSGAGMGQPSNMMMAWGGGIPRADVGMEVPMFGTGTLETLPNIENYEYGDYNAYKNNYDNYIRTLSFNTTTTLPPVSTGEYTPTWSEDELKVIQNFAGDNQVQGHLQGTEFDKKVKAYQNFHKDIVADTFNKPVKTYVAGTDSLGRPDTTGIPTRREIGESEKKNVNPEDKGFMDTYGFPLALGATALGSVALTKYGPRMATGAYNFVRKPIQNRFGKVPEINPTNLTKEQKETYDLKVNKVKDKIIERGYVNNPKYMTNELVRAGMPRAEAEAFVSQFQTREQARQTDKRARDQRTQPPPTSPTSQTGPVDPNAETGKTRTSAEIESSLARIKGEYDGVLSGQLPGYVVGDKGIEQIGNVPLLESEMKEIAEIQSKYPDPNQRKEAETAFYKKIYERAVVETKAELIGNYRRRMEAAKQILNDPASQNHSAARKTLEEIVFNNNTIENLKLREQTEGRSNANETRRINIAGVADGYQTLYGDAPKLEGTAVAVDVGDKSSVTSIRKNAIPATELGEGFFWDQQINKKGEKTFVLYNTNLKENTGGSGHMRNGHIAYTISVPLESSTSLEEVKQDLIKIHEEVLNKGGIQNNQIQKEVFQKDGFLGTTSSNNTFVPSARTASTGTGSSPIVLNIPPEGSVIETGTGSVAAEGNKTTETGTGNKTTKGSGTGNKTTQTQQVTTKTDAQIAKEIASRNKKATPTGNKTTGTGRGSVTTNKSTKTGTTSTRDKKAEGDKVLEKNVKTGAKKRGKKEYGGEAGPFIPQYGDVSYGAYNLPQYELGSDYSVNYAYGGNVYENAGQVDNCPCPEFDCNCPPGYTSKMGRQKIASDLEAQGAFDIMRPYYNDLFGYVNKGTRRDATVSPFRALIGTIGATLKHPEVWFRKRHSLPENLVYSNENPYGQEGYTYPIFGGMQSWYPNQYILPKEKKDRPSSGGGSSDRQLRRKDNRERRRINRDKGRTDCWGANCYENDEMQMGKHGGSYTGTWNGNQGFEYGGYYNPFESRTNPLSKFVYADGGMTPEEAMMMEQQAAAQGQPMPGQEMMQQAPEISEQQMQQVVQMIIEMMQQQMPPEQIMQNLVQQGVPQELAQQAIEMVMQQIQGAQQQGSAAPQQQMPSPEQMPMGMYGGMYARGGMVGQEMEVTEAELEDLRRRGIKFEIV